MVAPGKIIQACTVASLSTSPGSPRTRKTAATAETNWQHKKTKFKNMESELLHNFKIQDLTLFARNSLEII